MLLSKRITECLLKLFSSDAGSALRREVEEELQFHVEMRALGYQSQGFSADASRAMANQHFGNLSAVKRECLQISLRNQVGFRLMRVVCVMILAMGIIVRISSSDFRVAQIGQVLILIALLGSLLMFVKTVSALRRVRDEELLRLGLDNDGASSFAGRIT